VAGGTAHARTSHKTHPLYGFTRLTFASLLRRDRIQAAY